jgi:hypothetical protein
MTGETKRKWKRLAGSGVEACGERDAELGRNPANGAASPSGGDVEARVVVVLLQAE